MSFVLKCVYFARATGREAEHRLLATEPTALKGRFLRSSCDYYIIGSYILSVVVLSRGPRPSCAYFCCVMMVPIDKA